MERANKKSIGFGGRGWVLIIYQAIAFLAYIAFTNWPENALGDQLGGVTNITIYYLVGCVISVIVQFVLAKNIRKFKSIKKMSVVLGVISLALGMAMMLIPTSVTTLWLIVFAAELVAVQIWSTFAISILVGQWFPRRKGTVMGIATFAYPIGFGILLNVFMSNLYSPNNTGNTVFNAYLPFWILFVIGLLLCIFFIKDYPEQVGAFRDNDKSMTPEMANAMMEAEIQAKAKSVWTPKNTLKCRDFWFLVITEALLVLSASGLSVQLVPVLMGYNQELMMFAIPGIPLLAQGFSGVLMLMSVVACIGSWLIGMFDTRFGTKKAIILSVAIMLVAGIVGTFDNMWCVVAATLLMGFFQGAGSNFEVSAAARYWRREDFPAVYAMLGPIFTLLIAFGPLLIAFVAEKFNYHFSFGLIGIFALIGFVLIMLFNPKHIIEVDNKYRKEAGLPIDDELIKRFEMEK